MFVVEWKDAVQNLKNNKAVTDSTGHILVDMGSYVTGAEASLLNISKVMIGRYCSIGGQVKFLAGLDHDYRRATTSPLWIHEAIVNDDGGRIRPRRNHILIGNDVWIGEGARIMGGVKVGNGAVIGAGAVVAKDVAPYAIVVGNPARVLKYRFSEEIIAKLQRIKFWRWPYDKFRDNIPLIYDTEAFVQKHDPGVKRHEGELSRLFQKEKGKGKKICFFHSDFVVGDSLWEKVLEQYAFYAPQNLLLVIVSSGVARERELAAFRAKLESSNSGKGILYLQDFSPELYQNAEYYVAGTDYETLECVDYASDYGVRILSALDEDIFHWCGGSRDFIGERIEYVKALHKAR